MFGVSVAIRKHNKDFTKTFTWKLKNTRALFSLKKWRMRRHMTTTLKYIEEFWEKESNIFFFICVVDKAMADVFALLDRRVMLATRIRFIMIK